MAVALCRPECLRALFSVEIRDLLSFIAWTICIPTLKRYDLLVRLCLSLNSGSCRHLNLRICILDNGGGLLDSSLWRMSQAKFVFAKPEVIVPKYNLGVAGSWTFFFKNLALVSLPMMMWSLRRRQLIALLRHPWLFLKS